MGRPLRSRGRDWAHQLLGVLPPRPEASGVVAEGARDESHDHRGDHRLLRRGRAGILSANPQSMHHSGMSILFLLFLTYFRKHQHNYT